jgi:hypothetical protein
MAVPTDARPARPSGAPPPGARPAPVRPPQPAGPLPPAPPPGPEPPSESSTTTRQPPGRPARRRGPAHWAWGSPRPRSRPSGLRARSRCPGWARRGRPGSGRRRRALPDGLAAGGSGGGPGRGRGRGRVAGKPGQHRSDRLGLLLRKAAASLACQQVHLVGEPWRPWSWPSPAAATLAGGGLACRWLARRIGVGVVHARLLTHGDWHGWLSATAGGGGECLAPESRSCLDHADQGVHARPRALRTGRQRPAPTTIQRPSPQRGDVALVALPVLRPSGPADPQV